MSESDYTPMTEEMLDGYVTMRGREIPGDRVLASIQALSEAERWLAEHDAEKRAEWEAEQGTEYGVRLHPRIESKTGVNVAPWTPPTMPMPTMERAQETARMNPGYGATFHRRRKAGPWVPLEQEGE